MMLQMNWIDSNEKKKKVEKVEEKSGNVNNLSQRQIKREKEAGLE